MSKFVKGFIITFLYLLGVAIGISPLIVGAVFNQPWFLLGFLFTLPFCVGVWMMLNEN